MTLALPRDILNKFEQRWSARATQAEGFQAKTDRLKQNANAVAEGAQPLPELHRRQGKKPAKRN